MEPSSTISHPEVDPEPYSYAEMVENMDLVESAETYGFLQRSFERFAIARGAELMGDAALTDDENDTAEALDRGIASIRDNYVLLEGVGEQNVTEEKPDSTVCIPVAIMDEDPDSVLRTVQLVKRAQQDSGRSVELVLWANSRYGDGSDIDNTNIDIISRERYEALKLELANLAGDGLYIQSALKINSNGTAISQVRSDYMDAVAMQSVEKGYGYEHPVIWLDADTTNMTKNTLKDLADGVRRFDGKFVHADSRWSIDWADGPLSDQDDATKAVALNEIRRRQLVGMDKKNHEIQGAYTEEWGLAFAMGTYLESDGIDTSDPTNESMNLISRSFLRADSNNMPGELPQRWRRMPVVTTLPLAKLNTSARGLYNAVQKDGLSALPVYDNNTNSQYDMFTETARSDGESVRTVDAHDMRDVLRSDFGRVQLMERAPSQFGYETSEQVVAAWGLAQAVQDRLVERYFNQDDSRRK